MLRQATTAARWRITRLFMDLRARRDHRSDPGIFPIRREYGGWAVRPMHGWRSVRGIIRHWPIPVVSRQPIATRQWTGRWSGSASADPVTTWGWGRPAGDRQRWLRGLVWEKKPARYSESRCKRIAV